MNFNRMVYTVKDGEVVERMLSELCRDHAEETTTPDGIGPRYHIREEEELWLWGCYGLEYVQKYYWPAAAQHALLKLFYADLERSGVRFYDTYGEAYAALTNAIRAPMNGIAYSLALMASGGYCPIDKEVSYFLQNCRELRRSHGLPIERVKYIVSDIGKSITILPSGHLDKVLGIIDKELK